MRLSHDITDSQIGTSAKSVLRQEGGEKMTKKVLILLAHFEREIYFYNTFMTNKKGNLWLKQD